MRIAQTPLERTESVLIGSALILMVVITLQPMLNLLAVSLSDPSQIVGMDGLTILPRGLSTEVWGLLLTHPAVLTGVMNSAIITIGGTILNVLFTALMAWALARQNLPGRRLIFIMVLVTIVFVPGIVPDYFLNKRLGLLNTYWSVILLYTALNTPFNVYLMTSYLRGLPDELMEAARIDGAGTHATFVQVILPMARPALATLAVFNVLYAWNEFVFALLLLQSDSVKTATVGVLQLQGRFSVNYPVLVAGLLLTSLPVIGVYLFFQRYLVRAIVAGAVK